MMSAMGGLLGRVVGSEELAVYLPCLVCGVEWSRVSFNMYLILRRMPEKEPAVEDEPSLGPRDPGCPFINSRDSRSPHCH